MDEGIWFERAMIAGARIGALGVSADRWMYFAREVGRWFILDREDLLNLAIYTHDDPVNGYSLWCSAGYGCGLRAGYKLTVACPVCKSDSVYVEGSGHNLVGCGACAGQWSPGELNRLYAQSLGVSLVSEQSHSAGGV